MDKPTRCRGMRDMLPDEMRRFRRVEEAFRVACLGWGYEEIRTPVLEYLHLFTTAGTLSPQMLGRVYSFLDWDGWSGERVVLRPDSTIPTTRLYADSLDGGDVAKMFYVQNVFRFAEGDESREDWQCGVELIGDSQPQGDIELVLLGREVLTHLGLQVEVRLSHTGLVRAVLARAGLDASEQLALYDRILDGDDLALRELQERLPEVGGSLEMLLSMEGEGVAYLGNLRSSFGGSIPELERSLDELAAVASALEALGCRCLISAAMVRNFEYYTGPAFQFEVAGRRVGGGGRYDALLSLVAGRQVPASGFALEAGALAGLLSVEASERRIATVAVKAADGEALALAFRLASTLRAEGLTVQVAGTAPDGGPSVEVAGEGFVLSGVGGKARRLASVEAVAEALREIGCD
ncbi:MAG: ATP phosphoribosyltransferase regulatory subunit [Chloroflexi bacterium]|nr:ATP phosphoribosyltransferase regulatory subunit [Chloroflexota bacterium]